MTLNSHIPAISAAEITALKLWAEALPEAPRIVNIGAEHGMSTVALLEARSRAVIYSIDIKECQSELDNVALAGFDARQVTRLQGRSQDIDPRPYAPIDLLFIDGDHARESVTNDIRVWTPIVKQNGLIIFHDYIEPPLPPNVFSQVYYAVNDWLAARVDLSCIGRAESLIAFRKIND